MSKINLKRFEPAMALYAFYLLIVLFCLHRAWLDLQEAGKRTTAVTLSGRQAKELVDAKVKAAADLNESIATANFLAKHGRFREAEMVLSSCLNKAKREGRPLQSQILVLHELAIIDSRLLKFDSAAARLAEAFQMARDLPDPELKMMNLLDRLALAVQSAKFARTEAQRASAERSFDERLNELNALAATHDPPEKVRILIRNLHRFGLIEFGRLLELDNFDAEPARRLL